MVVDFERSLIVRALFYRSLALGFHEPSESLLAFLSSEEEFLMLREGAQTLEMDQVEKPIHQAVDQIRTAFEADPWSLQDLRVEYNRLFVGPTPPLVPPYESVYDQDRPLDEKGTVQGPSADRMKAALAEENLEMDLGRVDLYDHAAIELEFMYYLLGQALKDEGQLNQEYVDRASAFLKDHLGRWMPELGDMVASKTEHPFYHNLGSLLAAFVRQDLE